METLELNGKPFEVKALLGKGKGGYSYLVEGSALNHEGGGLYVLKQIHHEHCDYYQFGNKLESEMRDYRRLCEVGIPTPSLLDVDVTHERILKQYIPGETILDCVVSDRIQDSFLQQVMDMCKNLYSKGLNIDYFPTNFVVDDGSIVPANAGRLFYIDYECNQYMEEWDFEHWGSRYWSMTAELEEYLKNI
mgnify:FL=1